MKLIPNLTYNLFCIIIAQAMFMTINIMFYSFAPIVGNNLFNNPIYANLPIAVSLLSMVSFTIPFGIWTQKQGRRSVFIFGNISAIIAVILFSLGLFYSSIILFLLGAVGLGIGSAAMSFYRFAAMEVVSEKQQSFAISSIMLVGVLSAFIAPNIAIVTKNLFSTNFLASFLLMLPLAFIALIFISQVKWPKTLPLKMEKNQNQIDWHKLIMPILIGTISYFVMTLLMTGTPLHMHNHDFPFHDTAHVMQWHMVGMFAPSIFISYLVRKLGLNSLANVGLMLILLSILLNLWASSSLLLSISLGILGVGWNFSFISASQMLVKASIGQAQAKVQGINDFIIFGLSAFGSLGSSMILARSNWEMLNSISLASIVLLLTILVFNLKATNK